VLLQLVILSNIFTGGYIIIRALSCDVDLWSPGPGGCRQTLLHRALDENNESVACFLIKRSVSDNYR
jgi:hypothetical protein